MVSARRLRISLDRERPATGEGINVCIFKLRRGGAGIFGKTNYSCLHGVYLEDIARQRVLKRLGVAPIQRRLIGGLTAVELLTEPPHPPWNSHIANAHLPQVCIKVPAEGIEKKLSK